MLPSLHNSYLQPVSESSIVSLTTCDILTLGYHYFPQWFVITDFQCTALFLVCGYKVYFLYILIYVNDLPTPYHKQNSLSQFADDSGQWAFNLNVHFAAKLRQQDLLNLAMWCARWIIKLNLEKPR